MSKRDDILDKALELFNERGIENTPTSLISKEAGVATGTLFHHFKTKEELVNALYLQLKQQLRDSLHVDLASAVSVRDRIRVIWMAFTGWAIANSEKYRFLQVAGTSKYIEESTREQIESLFRDIYKTVEDGYGQEIFRIRPRELFHSIMTGHLYATLGYFIENPGRFETKETRDSAFASFWAALTAG